MGNLLAKMKEAVTYIESQTNIKPEFGLILGSGLGELADEIENAVKIDYESIPNFPVSTVEGHAGKLVMDYTLVTEHILLYDLSHDESDHFHGQL